MEILLIFFICLFSSHWAVLNQSGDFIQNIQSSKKCILLLTFLYKADSRDVVISFLYDSGRYEDVPIGEYISSVHAEIRVTEAILGGKYQVFTEHVTSLCESNALCNALKMANYNYMEHPMSNGCITFTGITLDYWHFWEKLYISFNCN